MPNFVADLHIHSHYSRATSQDLTLEQLAKWAQLKGVQVVATGDIAHPGWLQEIKERLDPAEEGLFQLKPAYQQAVQNQVPVACHQPVRFLLGGEVSNIYKKNGAVRKIHHLLFMPHLAAVEQLQARLEKIGNIRADGRPILGLDSRDLLEITLETAPQAYLIPAHIWTPWFAILGSKSGFDSIDECFDDLTPHIFALETGLSADPPMCWRIGNLDRYTLISNSDAHSPQKLAREATLLNTALNYPAIFAALHSGDPAACLGTLEFFPEEGKYHADGHRNCQLRWEPAETLRHQSICPVCGKPVTVGVLNRVATLASRPVGEKAPRAHPYYNLITLPEILAEVYGVGPSSKQVQHQYALLLEKLGPELTILRDLPPDTIAPVGGSLLAEGIRRMRAGEVSIAAGYDGEYGVIKLFDRSERTTLQNQLGFFAATESARPSRRKSAPEEQAPPAWEQPDLFAAPAPPPAADAVAGPARNGVASPTSVAELAPPSATQADQRPAATPALGLSLLAGLNAEQQAAAQCSDSHLLIVAGPGTGKTRTLTHRIAYLLTARAVAPQQILAITFTNKAAAEMQARLAQLLTTDQTERLTIKTFHALGAQILHEFGAQLGLVAEFGIVSEADQLALLRQLDPALSEKAGNQALAQIAAAKNQLLRPDAPALLAAYGAELAEIYRAYQAALRQQQLVDFDDLITQTVWLLEEHPAVLQTLHRRYGWISVDEYQDVNLAQYQLLNLLTAGGANLCAIGDPDQAIYGFRGADRNFFLRFQQDFPGAQILQLSQNYRSTQLILNAATQVIAKSGDRSAALQVWSNFLDQTKVDIHTAPTDKAEAEYVVQQIEQLVGGTSLYSLDTGRATGLEEGVRSFGDFAVLYRLNAQATGLAEALQRSGIPYQTIGQTPLIEYKEIRELLAYLWLAYNPQAQLYRSQIVAAAPKRLTTDITAFSSQLQASRSQHSVADLLAQVTDFLTTNLNRSYTEQQRERMQQLRRRATLFAADLPAFLETTALQQEADLYDPRADRVTLMTLHAAKGLEFPVVFLTGCEATLLPYQRPGLSTDEDEERRLFYVGMTRAQRKLILTRAQRRLLFGQTTWDAPSPFLNDIEQTLQEVKDLAQRKSAKPKPLLEQLTLFG